MTAHAKSDETIRTIVVVVILAAKMLGTNDIGFIATTCNSTRTKAGFLKRRCSLEKREHLLKYRHLPKCFQFESF